MDLSTLASIGEFLGGFAILISLIYLVFELRKQSEASKATASSEWTRMFHAINFEASRDPILAPLMRKCFDPATTREDLTDEEWFRFVLFARSIFVAWRGAFDLQAKGGLPEDLWLVQLKTARAFIQLPIWREWWDMDARESVGTDLVAEIEKAEQGNSGILSKR